MTTPRQRVIREIIKDQNPEALFLEDEFDPAIIGSCLKFGKKVVAAYSSDGCLKILMKNHKFCEIEAYEKFLDSLSSKNKEENYPVFISDFRKIKLIELKDFDIKTTIDQILRTDDPF